MYCSQMGLGGPVYSRVRRTKCWGRTALCALRGGGGAHLANTSGSSWIGLRMHSMCRRGGVRSSDTYSAPALALGRAPVGAVGKVALQLGVRIAHAAIRPYEDEAGVARCATGTELV